MRGKRPRFARMVFLHPEGVRHIRRSFRRCHVTALAGGGLGSATRGRCPGLGCPQPFGLKGKSLRESAPGFVSGYQPGFFMHGGGDLRPHLFVSEVRRIRAGEAFLAALVPCGRGDRGVMPAGAVVKWTEKPASVRTLGRAQSRCSLQVFRWPFRHLRRRGRPRSPMVRRGRRARARVDGRITRGVESRVAASQVCRTGELSVYSNHHGRAGYVPGGRASASRQNFVNAFISAAR